MLCSFFWELLFAHTHTRRTYTQRIHTYTEHAHTHTQCPPEMSSHVYPLLCPLLAEFRLLPCKMPPAATVSRWSWQRRAWHWWVQWHMRRQAWLVCTMVEHAWEGWAGGSCANGMVGRARLMHLMVQSHFRGLGWWISGAKSPRSQEGVLVSSTMHCARLKSKAKVLLCVGSPCCTCS